MQEHSAVVHRVLWTGGWDSTLWILRVLEDTDHVVEPHYVIYPERDSAAIEIRTMEKLRRLIEKHYPHARGRIRDTRVTHLQDIRHFPEHTEAFEAMRRERYVGRQYIWLADYCRTFDVAPIDLCSEAKTSLAFAFGDRMVRVEGDLENYELPAGNGAYSTLCHYFRLPLIHTDKPTMTAMAEARGWMPILKHTWFCHKPVMGRHACGTCRPCVYIMDRKQYFRLGLIGKLRFYGIERPKRLLPASFKDSLRHRLGPGIRRFLRA